jgi:hypothetical protein
VAIIKEDKAMNEVNYSEEIADAIADYLTEDDWNFSFDEERGAFKFGLKLGTKIKTLSYVVYVKERGYIVYAVSPISADESDPNVMSEIAEFICRANYGLVMGNFEFDFHDGEIRYKVHVVSDDEVPSSDIIRRSIYCPAIMFKRYAPGIVNVIFNDMPAETAIEKCEEIDDELSESDD